MKRWQETTQFVENPHVVMDLTFNCIAYQQITL